VAACPASAVDRVCRDRRQPRRAPSPIFMCATSTRAICPHRVMRLHPETTSNGWIMLRTLTTVLVVLAMGCGSSNGGNDRPTFAAMCSSAGAAINQVFVTCWKANPDVIAATNPLSQLVVPDCADLRKAIDAGRVTYDASSAQACLAALGSCGILTTFTPPAACRDALKGAVANGGTCYTSTDCQNGFCTAESSLSTCPGSCVAYAASGAPCGASAQCAPSQVCTGTCKTPSRAGGPCPCEANFYCDSGTCKPGQVSGGPCSDHGQCASSYVCVGAATKTCQAMVGLNGDCTQGAELCGPGYVCTSSRCVSAPGIGSACTDYICIDGYCDPTGHCAAWKRKGDACSETDACVTYTSCTNGMCTSLCPVP